MRRVGVIVLLGLVVAAPAALAGFEVHEVEAPDTPIAPEGGVGVIRVDLDVECQSVWLHDPYVIAAAVSSEAAVDGPSVINVTTALCPLPQGIAEIVPEWFVRVPIALPAYEPIPVTFTFTSGDHPLDAGESHPAEAAVEAAAAPDFSVDPMAVNRTVGDGTSVSLHLNNTGNTDLNLTWEGTGLQGFWDLALDPLPRGEARAVDARWTAPETWSAHTATLRFAASAPRSEEAPPLTVTVLLAPAEAAEDEASPVAAPAGVVMALLAAALCARRRV